MRWREYPKSATESSALHTEYGVQSAHRSNTYILTPYLVHTYGELLPSVCVCSVQSMNTTCDSPTLLREHPEGSRCGERRQPNQSPPRTLIVYVIVLTVAAAASGVFSVALTRHSSLGLWVFLPAYWSNRLRTVSPCGLASISHARRHTGPSRRFSTHSLGWEEKKQDGRNPLFFRPFATDFR